MCCSSLWEEDNYLYEASAAVDDLCFLFINTIPLLSYFVFSSLLQIIAAISIATAISIAEITKSLR